VARINLDQKLLDSLDLLETTIEEVPVKDLEIDPRIQRALDRNKILGIDKQFVKSALNVIAVSRRANGQIVVLDGQHRMEVVKKRPDIDTMVCKVYIGATLEQEAALFLTLNNTTKPTAIAKYKVQGTAGDEVVAGINEILAKYGYKVDTNVTSGSVGAVRALERIYRDSVRRGWEPNLLQLTLMVLNRAWGQSYDAVKGIVLEGMAALLDEYPTTLDIDKLIQKMRDYDDPKVAPKRLVTEAQSVAKVDGMRPAMAVSRVLVGIYNKGPGKKLPAWRRNR